MAHDTTELPSPDKPLEAGHDIKAWYQQRADYARYDGMPAVTKDFGSFDKESFYRALLTGNRDNREYRAMAEGSRSFSVTGGNRRHNSRLPVFRFLFLLFHAVRPFLHPTPRR